MDKDRLASLLERKVWKDELWFQMLDGMTPTFLWADGAPSFDPSVNQRHTAHWSGLAVEWLEMLDFKE